MAILAVDVFFFIKQFGIVCALIAVGLLLMLGIHLKRAKFPPSGGSTLFVTFLFLGIFALVYCCWWSADEIRKNNALPSREDIVSKMRSIALMSDEATVFSALRAEEYQPEMIKDAKTEWARGVLAEKFSAVEISHTATFIISIAGDVRQTKGIHGNVAGVFIFDSQKRLISWRDDLISHSL